MEGTGTHKDGDFTLCGIFDSDNCQYMAKKTTAMDEREWDFILLPCGLIGNMAVEGRLWLWLWKANWADDHWHRPSR